MDMWEDAQGPPSHISDEAQGPSSTWVVARLHDDGGVGADVVGVGSV